MNNDGAVAPLEERDHYVKVKKRRADNVDLRACFVSFGACDYSATHDQAGRGKTHDSLFATPPGIVEAGVTARFHGMDCDCGAIGHKGHDDTAR